MPVIVGVALGGALGASARYGVDRLIERSSNDRFMWSGEPIIAIRPWSTTHTRSASSASSR